MTNRNRLYRWLVVLILTGILGGVGLMIFCAPSRGVTRKNFDRIQPEMTEEEVREILGAGHCLYVGMGGEIITLYFDHRLPPWEPEEVRIIVTFTAKGVEAKQIDAVERTWKARLTEWLPW
jgi:hypothetical protein